MPEISDEQVSAFVDGEEDPSRLQAMRETIEADPEARDRVADYYRYNTGLQALYNPVAQEPIPEHLAGLVENYRPAPPPRRALPLWRLAAAFVLALGLGAGGGWYGHQYVAHEPSLLEGVVTQAVLAREMLEAVDPEKGGVLKVTQETISLVAESNPFKVPLRVPTSVGDGRFIPVSFQSTTGDTSPSVHLAYRSESGDEITMFVRPHSDGSGVSYDTAVVDGFDVLYWIDGPLVYVLVGKNGEQELLDLADAFYSSPGLRPNLMPAPSEAPVETPVSVPGETPIGTE
ncbi:MAG: anti-sigma factor family protein [Magnetospiraceae bacterium]